MNNLIRGVLTAERDISAVFAELPTWLHETLAKPPMQPEIVIKACENLSAELTDQEVLPILRMLGFSEEDSREQIAKLRLMFSRPYLQQRVARELGESYLRPQAYEPVDGLPVVEQRYPLGVLFHIAAGNMDGLPVLTVIEGLLAGNINLLKLPSVDGGLSVMILRRLLALEPRLCEYVYVFDIASAETASMEQLAELADAVVVWGGDETVATVRRMARPNTRVIEWGHKISFAYVTAEGWNTPELEGVARNICATNQLLCSSCQGIYLDSEDVAAAQQFCQDFLPVLERVAREYPPVPPSAAARQTLRRQAERLEGIYGSGPKVYDGQGVRIILREGELLESSHQFRQPWVRLLPRERLVAALHPNKNHLQTAALLCGAGEREMLEGLLWRAGVVRVCAGEAMSETYCGAPHDGEYTLQRYTKMVVGSR